MASGDTLMVFTVLGAEFPATNYATHDTRNNHSVLDFDDTTGETAYFTGIMPQHYADTTGITVITHWMTTSAGSGTSTVGWLIALERMADGGDDLDADSFAGNQTITAEAANTTAGKINVSSVAITKGANMDSVVAGDAFRLRITRDVGNDDQSGDAELVAVEIRET